MTYHEPLSQAADMMRVIGHHRDDAICSIERLKYQGGHSGNGVDFSNARAACKAIMRAAQQAESAIKAAEENDAIAEPVDGVPVTSNVHPLVTRTIVTETQPIRDYTEES